MPRGKNFLKVRQEEKRAKKIVKAT